MATVSDYFGISRSSGDSPPHQMLSNNRKVGIEIELENASNMMNINDRNWRAISDGSLRNGGVEYVTRGDGLCGNRLFQAIRYIDNHLSGSSVDDSWRCSTHVHVDARDLNPRQIKNIFLVYAVFEKFLFKCSGWHRYKNNFCVALGVGQSQIDILSNAWSRSDSAFFDHLVQNWNKYTAINVCTLSSLGTIEFRMSEAKFHRGRLIKLINRLTSVIELGATWEGTEADLISFCARTSVTDIFGKGLSKGFEANLDQDDIESGAVLANDIIFTSEYASQEMSNAISQAEEVVFSIRTFDYLNNRSESWLSERSLPTVWADCDDFSTSFPSLSGLDCSRILLLGTDPARLVLRNTEELRRLSANLSNAGMRNLSDLPNPNN